MPKALVVLDLAVTALAFAILALVFGYPWHLAVLLSFALGALSFSTRRTAATLRQLWHRENRRGPGEPPR